MRRALVVLHRWAGLFTAVFLFISGLTGAIISWDHELDEWLNPHLFQAQSRADKQRLLSGLEVADHLEVSDPRLRVRYVELTSEPGHTQVLMVKPRVDPSTGKLHQLGFDQVAVDPVSREVQGRRTWGEASLRRENLLPFLYRLHYTMHIPNGFGLELGMLFMGGVAIVWTLDAFVALIISFPSRKTWRRSFAFRLRDGNHKLNFDLHRSGGVWIWSLMLMLAVTAVSMNLNTQVMRPLVSMFSTLTPDAFSSRVMQPVDQPIEPTLTRREAIDHATALAVQRGIRAPAGGLLHLDEVGLYAVGFFAPGFEHGDGSLGNPWLYVDSRTGAPAGASIPGEGSAGDIFLQAQFPLHSGRLLGVPGRVLVSLLGLVVAMLSVTGLVIWARKRRARVHKARRVSQASHGATEASMSASQR